MDKEVETFLEHYGVKGMRWGIRKDRRSRAAPAETDVKVVIKPGKKLKVTGGKNQPPAEDVIRTSVTKQRIKKSGTQAVESKELQELVNRMNLESNYKKLSKKEREANKGLARKWIETQGKDLLMSQIKTNGKEVKELIKAAKDFDIDLSKIKLTSL